MLTLPALGLVGITVLATSFLSGIFGMAGGLILLGVLLMFMDVAPAMVLFGVIQTAANGWRALLWRQHVQWSIVWRFVLGACAMFLVMRTFAFIPDKAMLYLGLGIIPFAADLLPKRFTPDISRPGAPYICGAFIMLIQLLAGAAGHILDMFFQKSGLDRKAIVGTKAITQSVAHIFRIGYFGSIANAYTINVPWWAFVAAIGLAFSGTTLAASVLERMTDAHFRVWSRRIIFAVATSFLVRGVWLLAQG